MFVYVEDVDRTVSQLRASGSTVLREPAVMAWGERVAYLSDPDGNPVAVASRPVGNGCPIAMGGCRVEIAA
jgi:lactoylglutathione lyase